MFSPESMTKLEDLTVYSSSARLVSIGKNYSLDILFSLNYFAE